MDWDGRRAVLHVVHVIVVDQTEVRRSCLVGGMGDGQAVSCDRGHAWGSKKDDDSDD